MTDFHKIPFLLSGFMTVLVGIISYSTGAGSSNRIYLHMIIAMIAFFVIGKFTAETIESTVEEVEKKKREAELAEAAEVENVKGKNINLTADVNTVGSSSNKAATYSPGAKDAVQKAGPPDEDQMAAPAQESQDDGFEPLTVSRVISSALKK